MRRGHYESCGVCHQHPCGCRVKLDGALAQAAAALLTPAGIAALEEASRVATAERLASAREPKTMSIDVVTGLPEPKGAYQRRGAFVPCYDLVPLLTPVQLERLRPHLRPTFSETWKAVWEAYDLGDRQPLYDVQDAAHSLPSWAFLDPRPTERRLYERAQRERRPVIMGPPR